MAEPFSEQLLGVIPSSSALLCKQANERVYMKLKCRRILRWQCPGKTEFTKATQEPHPCIFLWNAAPVIFIHCMMEDAMQT